MECIIYWVIHLLHLFLILYIKPTVIFNHTVAFCQAFWQKDVWLRRCLCCISDCLTGDFSHNRGRLAEISPRLPRPAAHSASRGVWWCSFNLKSRRDKITGAATPSCSAIFSRPERKRWPVESRNVLSPLCCHDLCLFPVSLQPWFSGLAASLFWLRPIRFCLQGDTTLHLHTW